MYNSLFKCPYSNSPVGIRHRPVHVRVADAPTAEPCIGRNYCSTVAGYRCNVDIDVPSAPGIGIVLLNLTWIEITVLCLPSDNVQHERQR